MMFSQLAGGWAKRQTQLTPVEQASPRLARLGLAVVCVQLSANPCSQARQPASKPTHIYIYCGFRLVNYHTTGNAGLRDRLFSLLVAEADFAFRFWLQKQVSQRS